MDQVIRTCIRHTYDHRNLVIDPPEHSQQELLGFIGRHLLRLAHHSEHRDTGYATLDVEVRQPVSAFKVKRSVVGKWRRRYDVDAGYGFIELIFRHVVQSLALDVAIRMYCLFLSVTAVAKRCSPDT